MPVDLQQKIIFIHIPKTAGTSVEIAMGFIDYNGNDGLDLIKAGRMCGTQNNLFGNNRQHFCIAQIEDILIRNGENVREYTAFTIIRDPAKRLTSHYLARNGKWLIKTEYKKDNYLNAVIFLIRVTFTRILFAALGKLIPNPIARAIYPQHEHLRSQKYFLNNNRCRIELYDYGRINELSNMLKKRNYRSLGKYRATNSDATIRIQGLFEWYCKIFYSGDYKIYEKVKKSNVPFTLGKKVHKH